MIRAATLGGAIVAWFGAATQAAALTTGALQPAPLPVGTEAVTSVTCAPGSRECWAVGGTTAAFVLFSKDGGHTWSAARLPSGWSEATAVSCPRAGVCFVAVSTATASGILVTTDAGASWQARPFASDAPVGGLACPTAARCLAALSFNSAQAAVFESSDAAATWTSVAPPAGASPVWSVSCLDASHCWAAGGGIAGTADGGATWTQEYPSGPPAPGPAPPIVYGVSFVNTQQGWAVGGQQCGGVGVNCPGAVLQTSDGGRHWTVQEQLETGPYLTQLSCQAFGCLAVGGFSAKGGSQVLSWAGSGTAAPVAAAGLYAGGDRDAVATACQPWGCLVAGSSAGGQGFVLTTAPAAALTPVRQPWIAGLIPTFQQVSWRAGDVARSAILTLALLLVIGFPGQIFNSTLMAHYDEVRSWLSTPRRLLGRLQARAGIHRRAAGQPTPRWELASVFVLGGLFGALLDPRAGFDQVTLESFTGILLATAFTTTVYTLVRALALHRATRLRGRMRVYGVGVAIAAACLLVSRLTAAEPGYLYGVLLGYDLGRTVQLKRHHEGRIVGAAALTVLAVSVAVWLLWAPVSGAAQADPNSFGLGALSTAMAAVFLGGLTSLMFGLLPLRWLDGEKLFAWRRVIWAAAAGLCLFMFVHVVLRNAASAPQPPHSLIVTVALFVAFGALSMGSWLFFRVRGRGAPSLDTSLVGSVLLTAEPRRQPAAAVPPPPAPPSPSRGESKEEG